MLDNFNCGHARTPDKRGRPKAKPCGVKLSRGWHQLMNGRLWPCGHVKTASNTRHTTDGTTRCLDCHRAANRDYWERKKASRVISQEW